MTTMLVTGGGGFVGAAIIRQALTAGITCRSFSRRHHPALQALGVEQIAGDIRDPAALCAACRGMETVVHTAALAGVWGSRESYQQINVQGTANVIAACRQAGIGRLVYTSTPSVVFNGDDICGGDESLSYASRFRCHYARSKMLAEQLVLAANDETLATCALRPHLVWGPGDPHLIPRLLQQGRKKQLKIVGEGTNRVDISYVDNVACAHLLAAANLAGNRQAAGRAYFISDGEPVQLWTWINALFVKVGITTVQQRVPFPLVFAAGAMLEAWHGLVKPAQEPRMTRFVAEQLAKSHYFSIARAQQDFGYVPPVSSAEGMEQLLAWVDEHEKNWP